MTKQEVAGNHLFGIRHSAFGIPPARTALLVASAVCCVGVASNLGPGGLGAQETARPAGWNESTHGAKVAPDYRRLFAMDKVHELHITIPPDRFRAMQTDIATIGPMGMAGRIGRGRGAGGPPPIEALMEGAAAACGGKPAASACSVEGMEGQCTALFDGPLMCMPKALGNVLQGGAPNLTTRDPIYVPVTVRHDEAVWTQVGMRYKGNSSLMAVDSDGNGKIPFRLDFDRYEDDVPAISDQRFYGFQKLTFSSNFADDSQLREVLAAEILRDRGVPAARSSFYRVFVDSGTGAEYWGLYTMIEDPADGAMLNAQLGSGNGNLYKPEGPGANWTTFVAEGFGKKTNAGKADYSDVSAAVAALHAPRDDPRAWRAALEARLDVDGFLRWLAVNTVIENWDAYGAMAHNYYLYGDPARGGRLRWIPWDHNMAFGAGPGGGLRFGGVGPGGGPGRFGAVGPGGLPPGAALPFGLPPGALPPFGPGRGGANVPVPLMFGAGGTDVLHEQVGENWPLIRRLVSDDVYAARYRELLELALGGLSSPAAFETRASALHAMISSSVVGERGERPGRTTISSPAAFEGALDGPNGLIERMRRRHATVGEALERVKGR